MNTVLRLTDIESQQIDNAIRIKQEQRGFIDEMCCIKICIATTSSLLLSPFAICDVYYASTDIACLTQHDHHLAITLYSYLMASGVFMFGFIGALNVSIFVFDTNLLQPTSRDDRETSIWVHFCAYVVKSFHFAWLIVGCVLFWGYTDTFKCMDSTYHYLFARFVIAIVLSAANIINSKNKNT
jgi:hypothetical protein